MEDTPTVQKLFFQHLKENLSPHLSLVDEVAGLLGISNDSAYRRIRGEKPISFDEVRTLCLHFRISLDRLFHLNTDTIIFEGKFTSSTNFDFESYLRDLLQLLIYTSSFQEKEILFMSKDIPIFHYFHFPELAAFKSFFWMKTILQYPVYNKKRFVADEISPSTIQICTKLIDAYNKIPSQEIWHIESIHATIQQIEYYKDTRMFASDKDLETVYACLQKTIDHVETQAEQGVKLSLAAGRQSGSPFTLYVNEFILGDNTYLVRLGEARMVVLNHSVLNTIRTKDAHFSKCTEEHFQNIIRRSTQVSEVSEKERSRFFNVLREKVEDSRKT